MILHKTFFLDQGEFLGGAERFLIDFVSSLKESEIQRIRPIILGASSDDYKNLLAEKTIGKKNKIIIKKFYIPSVRGGFFKKSWIIMTLIFASFHLTLKAKKHGVNNFFTNTPRTHFVLFLAKKIFKLKGQWICCFHDFTMPVSLINKIAKHADVLLANSMPTRTFLRKNIDEKCFSKIKIIENGIDLTNIPEPIYTKEIKQVLVMGRIDPRKGQKYALECAKKLQKEDFYFKFIGSPVQDDLRTMNYYESLQKFVKQNMLQNVEFIKEVQNPFAEIMKTDIVLVLPTEPETFGRIVIEALSVGKIVLAFAETGPKEILKQFQLFIEKYGNLTKPLPLDFFLVKKLSVDDLTTKIQFLQNNSELVSQAVLYGKSFVEKKYNLKETRKRLLDLLCQNN